MFGKLLKYEWRAAGHALLPFYLVVLAVSAVNSLMIHLGSGGPSEELMGSALGELIQLLGFMLYFGVIVALIILTAVVIVQRFYKGIVGDEGCLVLTAPVDLWEIPLAKCVIGLVFTGLSVMAGVCSIIILMNPAELLRMIREVDWLRAIEQLNLYVPQWGMYGAEIILSLMLAGMAEMYHVYLAIMLGQLSNTHKAAFSFLWYVVINVVFTALSWFAFAGFDVHSLDLLFLEMGAHAALLSSIGISALQVLLFAAGTQYLMAKRMNV